MGCHSPATPLQCPARGSKVLGLEQGHREGVVASTRLSGVRQRALALAKSLPSSVNPTSLGDSPRRSWRLSRACHLLRERCWSLRDNAGATTPPAGALPCVWDARGAPGGTRIFLIYRGGHGNFRHSLRSRAAWKAAWAARPASVFTSNTRRRPGRETVGSSSAMPAWI